jgi:hypothetical protein
VKIGVGIGHTATGGKFLRRAHENGRASTSNRYILVLSKGVCEHVSRE